MLPMPVVDASVCVALFKADEPGHEAAMAWLTETLSSGEPIVSPAILLPEVAAALARGLAMGSAAVSRAVELLRRRTLVELFPVTEALAVRAAAIAAEHRLRGTDAIYVALAGRLEMHLITFDRQQVERGAAVVEIRRPGGGATP
jgi:predicted nucleic acid-binding protein